MGSRGARDGRTRRAAIGKWCGLWLGASVCAGLGTGACAEPPEAPAATESRPAHVVAEPPLRLAAPLSAIAWQTRAALELERPARRQGAGLSIVELPQVGVPGARTRPRHALSIRSDYPKQMLRSMGIDATDCATRFRLPTKLRRDADGSGSSIELRADLGLACRF